MMIIYLISAVFAFFYIFVKRKHSYWKRLGVPYIEPEFFWGNSRGIDNEFHHSEFWRRSYQKLKKNGSPIQGVYVYTEPVAMVTSLDLLKNILVKDFDCFNNRGGYIDEKSNPCTGHIVNIEDERWRNLRNQVTPFFINGRLKTYLPRIAKLADTFLDRIDIEDDLEMRELVSRLGVDVLGKVLFTKEFNQLAHHKKDISDIVGSAQRDIRFRIKTLAEAYRKLLIFLHLKVIPKPVVCFLDNLVCDTIKDRESSKEKNTDDLIDVLDSIRKSKENPIKLYEIVANAGAFFIAGHDNLTSSIRHTLYELSKSPTLQTRCRESIKEVLKKHNNELTFEAIMDMTFLEQCIFETFRIHVVSIFTRRVARYDYKVPGTNITIEKGTMVQIPTFAIHNDPEIYPNPEVYDPDRMAPEEVKKRHPYSFLPFGMGPHQCVGFRLGLLTAKMTLAKTLLKYEFEIDPTKTPDKLTFNPKGLFMSTEGTDDIYMKFKKIQN